MIKGLSMKIFIIFINLLYVTARKPTVYDQIIDSLLESLRFEGMWKLVEVIAVSELHML